MGLYIATEETAHINSSTDLAPGDWALYPFSGAIYVVEFGGSPQPIGLTASQLSLLNNALQPSDNVSLLTNDADYQSGADVSNTVNAAIANLINSAPLALDTLNELAAALGNDPNFATTITNSLATKADKTITISGGGGLTGGGDLSANRTISMPDVVTAGSSGAANSTLSVTVDAKGRITAFSRTAISIVASAITNFAATVRSTVLTGISFASDADVLSTDSILVAIGKLQAKFTNLAFPTPDRDSATGSGITFTNGGFTNIPGMSNTVTLNDTGTIDAMFLYSAARSGFTNSEAQFRVVINGNNGQTFNDTFSTFNDTGGASHFVEGLAAGTYTITAQAAVSAGINIAACRLASVATED